MNEPFGASDTKFQAVREQILDYARDRPDSAIALRFTGGMCSTEGYAPPAVTFDRDNTDEIEAALGDIRAGGDSDFAVAVGKAVNDFDHYEADGRQGCGRFGRSSARLMTRVGRTRFARYGLRWKALISLSSSISLASAPRREKRTDSGDSSGA